MNKHPKIKTKGSILKIAVLCSIPVVIITSVMLVINYDKIITYYLAKKITNVDTGPKTFIKKTVDYPGSIYWEDNVYHGYNEDERYIMIRHYLDGVHLKTMALNGPDGNIYIYTATEKDWHSGKEGNLSIEKINYETRKIVSQGKAINKNELPQFNYSVIVKPVPLTPYQSRYLYSDEVVIIDNKANEVIAYNRRLMRYYFKFELEPVGGCKCLTRLYDKSFYGLPNQYEFDDQVILLFRKIDFYNDISDFKCKRSFKSRPIRRS